MEKKELTEKERRESYLYEEQRMIYYDLPVLISKIFHSAFANCECGTSPIMKEDMELIKGAIKETENIFKIAMEGQKRQLEEMLRMYE